MNQGKGPSQSLLLLSVRLLSLWLVGTTWVWAGVKLAISPLSSTTWLIAGLTFLGWVLLTCAGIKWLFAQYGKATYNTRLLLAGVYLMFSLPLLATLLWLFFYGLGLKGGGF